MALTCALDHVVDDETASLQKNSTDNCMVLGSILAQRECQSSLLLLSFDR